MASWMTHLRIAERLLEDCNVFTESFLVGNIAPDSGVPNGNGGFTPPKEITHWKDSNVSFVESDNINPHAFFQHYLKGKQKIHIREYSFLIGYYIHLLTDIYWHQFMMNKKICNEIIREELKEDPKPFREELKTLDLFYLQEKNNVYNGIFEHIKEAPDYLPYFPQGAILKHVETIKEYYNYNSMNRDICRYVTNEELSYFITDSVKRIRMHLTKLKHLGS